MASVRRLATRVARLSLASLVLRGAMLPAMFGRVEEMVGTSYHQVENGKLLSVRIIR
jgi:hypothetical protein